MTIVNLTEEYKSRDLEAEELERQLREHHENLNLVKFASRFAYIGSRTLYSVTTDSGRTVYVEGFPRGQFMIGTDHNETCSYVTGTVLCLNVPSYNKNRLEVGDKISIQDGKRSGCLTDPDQIKLFDIFKEAANDYCKK